MHIFFFPRIITNDDKLLVRLTLLECADQMMDTVFRNQPADKEHIFAAAQCETVQPFLPVTSGFPHAVGYERRFRSIHLAVILLNGARVRDQAVAKPSCHAFGCSQIPSCEPSPFSALPVHTVHGANNFHAEKPRNWSEKGGTGNEIVGYINAVKDDMQCRQEGVHDGTQVLRPQSG